MTLNAVMLSLGPSLNISGSVLAELLSNRETLFASPPPISGAETATAVINFGDLEVPPPSPFPDGETTPSPPIPADQSSIASTSASSTSKRKAPRLDKKSSVNRLFTIAGNSDHAKMQSAETLNSSVVNVDPPRVDVPLDKPLSPLPTFADIPPEEPPTEATVPASAGLSKGEDSVEVIETDKGPTTDAGFHPNPVKEQKPQRPPSTPTPIADRFSSGHIDFPSLRSPKSSTAPDSTPNSHPLPQPNASPASVSALALALDSSSVPSTPNPTSNPNPATVIRRGAPVFFQSSANLDKNRSRSASVTPNHSVTKRKDESPTGTPGSANDMAGKVKRLSAGPGPVNVKEVLRSMEMTA